MIFEVRGRKKQKSGRSDISRGSLLIPTRLFNLANQNFLCVQVNNRILSLSFKNSLYRSSTLSDCRIRSVLPSKNYRLTTLKSRHLNFLTVSHEIQRIAATLWEICLFCLYVGVTSDLFKSRSTIHPLT